MRVAAFPALVAPSNSFFPRHTASVMKVARQRMRVAKRASFAFSALVAPSNSFSLGFALALVIYHPFCFFSCPFAVRATVAPPRDFRRHVRPAGGALLLLHLNLQQSACHSEVSVEELREKCEPRNGFTIVLVFLFVSVVVLVVGVTLRGRGRGRGAGAGAGAGGGGEGGKGGCSGAAAV